MDQNGNINKSGVIEIPGAKQISELEIQRAKDGTALIEALTKKETNGTHKEKEEVR